MTFESYKIATTNQLSAWNHTIRENALNISDGTIKKAEYFYHATMIVGGAKAFYDNNYGAFTTLFTLFSVAVGIIYVDQAKHDYAKVKNRVKNSIVTQAKELRPDWANKTDKEIITLVKENSNLNLPTDQQHVRSIALNLFKEGYKNKAINNAVKEYLAHSRLKPVS